MPSDWVLGIDFGTVFTVAAVHEDGRTRVLDVGGHGRFPSAVLLDDDGAVVVGDSAERRGAGAPERVEHTPKRYLDVGQPPIVLGDRLVAVTDLVGAVLRAAWDEALRQHGGVPPSAVVLTHPAGWGPRRRELLLEAAAKGGLPRPDLLSEPEAAALHLASERSAGAPIGDGDYVAVYDLGGGTFDAAVLRRSGSAFELVGEPGGDPRIGGEVFDDRLYRRIGATGLDADVWSALQSSDEDAWRRANWEFRRQVRGAKEAVSRDASSPVYVPSPVDRTLQVTRDEFEELIRDDVASTLDILQQTIEKAGITPDRLSAVFLVGGSSRIPLVGHLVRERFGRADTKGDPKQAVALGAAQAGALAPARAVPVAAAVTEPPLASILGGGATPPPQASTPGRAGRPRWVIPGIAAAVVVVGVVAAVALVGGGGSSDAPAYVPADNTGSATPNDPQGEITDSQAASTVPAWLVGQWDGQGVGAGALKLFVSTDGTYEVDAEKVVCDRGDVIVDNGSLALETVSGSPCIPPGDWVRSTDPSSGRPALTLTMPGGQDYYFVRQSGESRGAVDSPTGSAIPTELAGVWLGQNDGHALGGTLHLNEDGTYRWDYGNKCEEGLVTVSGSEIDLDKNPSGPPDSGCTSNGAGHYLWAVSADPNNTYSSVLKMYLNGDTDQLWYWAK